MWNGCPTCESPLETPTPEDPQTLALAKQYCPSRQPGCDFRGNGWSRQTHKCVLTTLFTRFTMTTHTLENKWKTGIQSIATWYALNVRTSMSTSLVCWINKSAKLYLKGRGFDICPISVKSIIPHRTITESTKESLKYSRYKIYIETQNWAPLYSTTSSPYTQTPKSALIQPLAPPTIRLPQTPIPHIHREDNWVNTKSLSITMYMAGRGSTMVAISIRRTSDVTVGGIPDLRLPAFPWKGPSAHWSHLIRASRRQHQRYEYDGWGK